MREAKSCYIRGREDASKECGQLLDARDRRISELEATALYKDAIQRADSNYAAFEQVTKIAEGLREHLRKMLDALPAERAREIADHHMHAENCDVMRMRSTVPHPCNCWSDGDARTLNAYAQVAKDAQASLCGDEDPKP